MKTKRFLFQMVLMALVGCLFSCKDKTSSASQGVVEAATYKLYPTQNMWDFLKLNTVDGRIWIVQYSVGDGNRLEAPLNKYSLLGKNVPSRIGRFALVPTSNMWNFILLDQVDGKQWQVQWGFDSKNYQVIEIK